MSGKQELYDAPGRLVKPGLTSIDLPVCWTQSNHAGRSGVTISITGHSVAGYGIESTQTFV